MDGGQRSVVAGVHRLHHVEGFAAANLTNEDPVRPHAQRVPEQVALGDCVLALDVAGACFHRDHVPLLELEFHRVFDGDDSLLLGDVLGERVEEGRLAATRPAGDQDVQSQLDAVPQELRGFAVERSVVGQLLQRVLVAAELADGDHG